ncbi:hypothetical protein [Phnomibacter sp. MR]|uniref:hypothetical protein n=1 Tax=Phnomibacter sp. MR TaxID=3042318 RepID=UPI003A7FEF86
MISNTTNDLLRDFMKPTESKGPETINPIEEEKVASKATSAEPLELEAEEVKADPQPKKERMMGAEFVAETFLGMFDTTQSIILSKINRRKMKRRLGEKLPEAEKLINEIELGRIEPKDLTPEQYQIFLRIKDLMKVEEMIPLTDEEYEKLKVPLMRLVEVNNIDLPPNLALFMTAIDVMAPRIIDAFFE